MPLRSGCLEDEPSLVGLEPFPHACGEYVGDLFFPVLLGDLGVAGRDFPPQVLPHDCDGCFPDQLDGLLLFEFDCGELLREQALELIKLDRLLPEQDLLPRIVAGVDRLCAKGEFRLFGALRLIARGDRELDLLRAREALRDLLELDPARGRPPPVQALIQNARILQIRKLFDVAGARALELPVRVLPCGESLLGRNPDLLRNPPLIIRKNRFDRLLKSCRSRYRCCRCRGSQLRSRSLGPLRN